MSPTIFREKGLRFFFFSREEARLHVHVSSGVEFLDVAPGGFRLRIDGRKHCLLFEHFPWFRDASTAELATIERPTPTHFRWPLLDVDLTLDSIERPERYPLVSGWSAR